LYGTTPKYFTIRGWDKPEKGRFLNSKDIENRDRVVVIGLTVVEALFGGGDPVGQSIKIKGQDFRVVGVLPKKGDGEDGFSLDDIVVGPWTTFDKFLSSQQTGHVKLIMAQAASKEKLGAAKKEITDVLREEHRLKPGEPDNFRVEDN
jgi:putative ABC transport system permease protein